VDEGTWVEVMTGLHEGEEVITAGIDGLGDGSKVRVARDVDPYTGARAKNVVDGAAKPPTN
jgi:hypothetical protein